MTAPVAKIVPAGLPERLPRLVRTGFANLRRDRFSGVYFAHAKVCGRLVRESLKTKSRLIAKDRLEALITARRALWAGTGQSKRMLVENYRMAVLLTEFADEVAAARLKPRSKKYRLATLKLLQREWPELAKRRPRDVTPEVVRKWAAEFRAMNYSPGLFNSTLDTLRMVFERAVAKHLVVRNPVVIGRRSQGVNGGGIRKEEVLSNAKTLPTDDQVAALLRALRGRPDWLRAYWFVRVLLYSGQRPESVRTLYPRHVDLDLQVVHWPPVKHNRKSNPQPMHRQLRVVLRTLMRLHPGGDKPLLPIKSARRALAAACRAAKIVPVLTEGVFRHWFTSRALAAGLPVPAVAAMRGDRDGGAMLLRTYNHQQIEDLRKEVRKL